ncbi:MAG TPA: LuxR C-terminal-related transcriptional regulator [Iamia sp.]
MPTTWPLAGREADIASALAVIDGDQAGLLLVGAAGVGKSRLAEELAERLALAGHHVARMAGSAATSSLPLAAAAPLLPADVADSGLPALLSFRRALAEASGGRPVTLVVDDAHLLDEASATLVHQLAMAGEANLLATQRSGTVAPDVIERLWWDGVVARVEIAPLPRAAAEELGSNIAGRPLDAAAAERLWALTEGNPLFVRELLLAERQLGGEDEAAPAGAEVEPSSSRVADDAVPRLADLVHRRLAGLDTEARDLLRAIAFGEPLGAGELDHLAPSSTLVVLERAGLIAADPDERRLVVRVVHPFYGEVLRAETPPDERRAILYRLAEGLQATGARRRGDAVRLATWSVESGLDVDPELLTRAARIARFSSDFELAERLAREAFARERTFAVGEVLADILYQAGDADGTAAVADELDELVTTEDEQAMAAMVRAISEYWHRGDEAAALRALDAVDLLVPSEWTDEAVCVRATLSAFSGRPGPARDLAEPLITRPPGRVHIQAALALNQAFRSQIRPEQALDVVEQALEVYAALGEQGLLIGSRELGAARIACLVESGRFAEAEAYAEEWARRAEETGETSRMAHTLLSEGWLRLLQGRTAAAVEALTGSARSFELMGHWGMQRWSRAALALALAQRGDAAAARAELDAVDRTEGHPARVYDQSVYRARAAVAWLDGDHDEAHRLLVAGADALAATGDLNGEVACLHDVVRLGRAETVQARLDGVLAGAEGRYFALLRDHAAAVVARSADALGAVAEGFAEMGAWLLASEAAHAADEAARAGGDPRSAAAWAVKGEQWRARCDEVRSPGLVAASAPVPLTRREREVAQLAAEGLPRKDMAEQLYVGVRTVDSHLVRIYAKLGVRNRAELASALETQLAS